MLTLPFGYVTEPLTRHGLAVYRLVKQIHMAIVWGLSDGMATVRLQRLECVNITGSVRPPQLLLGFCLVSHPFIQWQTLWQELWLASSWPGRASYVGHAQIPTSLTESHHFYISQDKMVPITAFATPLIVKILLGEHWL